MQQPTGQQGSQEQGTAAAASLGTAGYGTGLRAANAASSGAAFGQQQTDIGTNRSYGTYGTVAPGTGQTESAQQISSSMLTRLGVSNFSQQVTVAQQKLQRVQQELVQAQNQIEVQSQAQIRQLRQLQQIIDQASMEIQQIQSASQGQARQGTIPMS